MLMISFVAADGLGKSVFLLYFVIVMFYTDNFSNFDVLLIIFFPILDKGLFPKLLDKALILIVLKMWFAFDICRKY